MIFTGYTTGSKNPVWNRLKIEFVELDFSNLIFQKSSTDQQGDSMTQLLIHTAAHFIRPSFRPKTNLSKIRQNVQNSDFQSQFSMSEF